MKALKSLIQQYFPNENILNETNVKLKDTWVAKAGKFPLSASKFFYMKPMPMIETDKKFYFDKRVPLLFQSIISIFTGPLWLMLFFFVVQTLTQVHYPKEIYIAIFLLGILVGIINTVMNKNSILNILAIDKSWISGNYEEAEEKVLKGFIPVGSASYFLYSHVPEEQLDKKILKKFPKNMFYDSNFTLKYKIVN